MSRQTGMQFLQAGQLAVPQGSQNFPGPHESHEPGTQGSAHSPVSKRQRFGAQSSCVVQNPPPDDADDTDFALLALLEVLLLDAPLPPPAPGSSRTTTPPQPANSGRINQEARSQVMGRGYVSSREEACAGSPSRR